MLKNEKGPSPQSVSVIIKKNWPHETAKMRRVIISDDRLAIFYKSLSNPKNPSAPKKDTSQSAANSPTEATPNHTRYRRLRLSSGIPLHNANSLRAMVKTLADAVGGM